MLFLVLFVVLQIFSDDSDSTKSGSDSLAPRYTAAKQVHVYFYDISSCVLILYPTSTDIQHVVEVLGVLEVLDVTVTVIGDDQEDPVVLVLET